MALEQAEHALAGAESLLLATAFDLAELAMHRAEEMWKRAIKARRLHTKEDLQRSDEFHKRLIRLAMNLVNAKRISGRDDNDQQTKRAGA